MPFVGLGISKKPQLVRVSLDGRRTHAALRLRISDDADGRTYPLKLGNGLWSGGNQIRHKPIAPTRKTPHVVFFLLLMHVPKKVTTHLVGMHLGTVGHMIDCVPPRASLQQLFELASAV